MDQNLWFWFNFRDDWPSRQDGDGSHPVTCQSRSCIALSTSSLHPSVNKRHLAAASSSVRSRLLLSPTWSGLIWRGSECSAEPPGSDSSACGAPPPPSHSAYSPSPANPPPSRFGWSAPRCPRSATWSLGCRGSGPKPEQKFIVHDTKQLQLHHFSQS